MIMEPASSVLLVHTTPHHLLPRRPTHPSSTTVHASPPPPPIIATDGVRYSLLHPRAPPLLRMNNTPHPVFHLHSSSQLPPHPSSLVAPGASPLDGQLFQSSMGGLTAAAQTELQAARLHQRTPSASTVNSNGPASPYLQNISYPDIANPDQSPAYFLEYSKLLTPSHTPVQANYLAPGYLPTQQASSAHQAMKAFAIDHHTDDFIPDYTHSSRRSMSSRGHDSPATPRSGAGETVDTTHYNLSNNGEAAPFSRAAGWDDCLLYRDVDYTRSANPNVQLFRTESQAYQDELYNPSLAIGTTSAPAAKPAGTYLSPNPSIMSQRLQTANNARGQSPKAGSAVSRERSPFRDGSPFAGNNLIRSPNGVGTAASMRQHQKEQAEQAEYAQHRPQLNREPTKTISPKDAMLDYNDQDQVPLFQDNVPTGYKQHTGASEQWQQGFSFGTLQMQPTPAQLPVNFRATSGDALATNDAYAFLNLPQQTPGAQNQVPNAYPAPSYARAKMPIYPPTDPTPAFPATLTSMESSTGSQEDDTNLHVASHVQRPADTRANAGSYTCTYHGCIQRFDSPANLQKHRREVHRAQQKGHREVANDGSGTGASSASPSESPRSSESPDPSTAGMTSAAIMARNSQAGPHRCTRINPSTNKPCNTIFSRPYDLTRHEDTIHNGRKQKVRCPMCREEKTFSRNDALTRHMRVVHPEAEAFGKRGRHD